MTHEQVVDRLLHWMKSFVEVPHPTLGNFPPCPYARQARVGNKMEIIPSRFGNLVNDIENNLSKLKDKDVLVFWFDHNAVDPMTLASLVKAYNNVLMPHGFVILEDHPDSAEFVSGVHMNFGYCGLLLVSDLVKLNTASKQLRSRGYYDHWDRQSLDDVVNWRFK